MAYIGKSPADTFRGLAYYDSFTGDGSTGDVLRVEASSGTSLDATITVLEDV